MSNFDLVVRSGTLVDGTGAPPRTADVAILDGLVVEVGKVKGRGHLELDAAGAIVAPGFVDIHTHYDGQAVWDDRLQPSSGHGVTTVVAGNCGVGFAPVRAEHRDLLIELMEGVEDIPGIALHEGLSWDWSSFGEYLDVLDSRPRDIDLATQVPHAALRFFAMGERAAAFTQATKDEIASMAQLAREAVLAGALGFTTSRTLHHRTKAGALTPVYGTEADELAEIAAAVGSAGTGVLQLITDFTDLDEDFALMRRMVEVSGRPLSVSVTQLPNRPDQYRQVLERIEEANSDGFDIKGQVASRCQAILMGLQCAVNPFTMNPVWQRISHLSGAEQARRMAEPGMRADILAAQAPNGVANDQVVSLIHRYESMYELGVIPNYEPDPKDSFAAQAARNGCTAEELVYDALIADEGRGMVWQVLYNYADGSLDAVREMLVHDHTIPGLGDGGAHVATICDSSFPTFLLQHWVRDRPSGRLDLPFVIQRQARDTAQALGLHDRGQLRAGYKADLNVIDMAEVRLHRPEMSFDLPAGGRRLLQRADGYRHTIVSGVETYRYGRATGKLPGVVVRGARSMPPKRD